ncbi:hypothetical protein R1flu_007960 [Riccia fluitans]|uniref:Uncharacterized protein n=1 Tax=Riccia fluitans TaxID=41844 RepID=A0ABD1YAJ1_9MARC
MNSGLRNKIWTQSLIWRNAMQKPRKVSTRSLLACVGLGTPGSGKGIDLILPCTHGIRGSEKGINSILPPARRTRETPGSKKVTHLPLRSEEPKKGIDSISPCARRTRDSRLWNLARAGLETPGIQDSYAKPVK